MLNFMNTRSHTLAFYLYSWQSLVKAVLIVAIVVAAAAVVTAAAIVA